ncbi:MULTISPECIES: glycosyltransferase family 2 protein [unclassified Micromonospora]|uniref:glycosyltransferase family 2 protein n=1 Tax=unclassified Micromonospora TaxID=2617518 RepID=UPI001034277A|nr:MULTISPECIES: glycosyltransferase [unclassified Micromonospora]QKW16764.1 glycosyltransferase [Verrucosispora sp. NA02020]TBL32290.1 glycosyltransferase [Verrucosispora sp. SN26_14.1]
MSRSPQSFRSEPTAPPGVERGVSVVIPVKDRVPEMRRQLRSLQQAARNCPEPVEVVVVDDSAPAAAAAHRAACAQYGARYVRGPRHVGAKRNLGVRHARHDLLLFTDSDCRVPEDLITRYAARLRASGEEVAGVTGPVLVEPGEGAFFRVMSRSYLLLGDLTRPLHHERVSWGAGANTAVKRVAFDAVGGFPEDSPMPIGGEDLHLGLLLTDAGYALLAEPEAVVTHDTSVAETVGAVAYRFTTYGRSEQWLCLAHPHRRRFVLNTVSALAVTAAAGLATARRTGGRSLLAVPAVAAALVAAKTPGRLGDDRGPRALAESVACVAIETLFDGAAFVTALRMRRPDLLFTGFRAPDEADYQPVAPSRAEPVAA